LGCLFTAAPDKPANLARWVATLDRIPSAVIESLLVTAVVFWAV
jgi:hypothetical protein